MRYLLSSRLHFLLFLCIATGVRLAFFVLDLANVLASTHFCGFPKAALPSIIPFQSALSLFYVFYDMTLAGLDDTHTTGWNEMDGRDLVQLSGQRNGRLSRWLSFLYEEFLPLTARYARYRHEQKHVQNCIN